MRRVSRTSRGARRKAVMRVFSVVFLAISIASQLAAAEWLGKYQRWKRGVPDPPVGSTST